MNYSVTATVSARQIRRRPRLAPILGSIGAHGLFFAWLFAGPLPRNPSAYRQLIQPHETKLVWYNFKRKLPDVSPVSRKSENRPLKAEALDKQQIVSAPRDAPKAPQMIFHPVPELKPQPVTPLPNMIALAAPPPPPPTRAFQPPKPVAAKPVSVARPMEPAKAPDIEAKLTPPQVPLSTLPKLFTPPPPRPQPKADVKAGAKVDIAVAPDVQQATTDLNKSAGRTLDQASRIWVFRPQVKTSKTVGVGEIPDVPSIPGPSLSNANVAVVGLNPIENLKAPLPDGSRRAQFSAGPKLNPDGATSSGISSGITVPDLTVRGGEKSTAAAIIARTMSPALGLPSSKDALGDTPHAGPESPDTVSNSLPPGIRVSNAPDPRFEGRTVFSVAIQTPNLTSHMGSWLMWYADRTMFRNRANLSAPTPVHEVDPKYIATAAEEHVEGVVRLAFVIGHDGRVYGVETVKGVDTRLDRSATEALQKWVFTPATRDGQPIDVDALVEIPFHLAPPPPK